MHVTIRALAFYTISDYCRARCFESHGITEAGMVCGNTVFVTVTTRLFESSGV